MDFGLNNRVALVAAGSAGIGFAAARELAREGVRGFLCGRDEVRARAAAERITAAPGTACLGVRAGLTGWAKTLSNELAAEGVTVNSIAPGWTLTEHQAELAEMRGRAQGKTAEEMVASWAAQIPAARLAGPEEIAAAVAFLASE